MYFCTSVSFFPLFCHLIHSRKTCTLVCAFCFFFLFFFLFLFNRIHSRNARTTLRTFRFSFLFLFFSILFFYKKFPKMHVLSPRPTYLRNNTCLAHDDADNLIYQQVQEPTVLERRPKRRGNN